MEALEFAVHVGLRIQAALFEFLLHLGSVPWLDTPGDVVDQTGDSRAIRASCCALVSCAIPDDDEHRTTRCDMNYAATGGEGYSILGKER